MSEVSYLERKAAWAEKAVMQRGATPLENASDDRVPPGQRVTEDFPVLDLGMRPEFPEGDAGRWTLEIDGEVEEPLTLDLDGLSDFPSFEDVSDFHCVTTWSKLDCRWGGVAFPDLLDRVRPRDGADYVSFLSYDGYDTNVRTADLLAPGALLATHFDGKPLTRKHGAPARTVIPHLYAWKSAKFIRRITFSTEDTPGYWERRGYSTTADPWRDDRFAAPQDSA